MNLHLTLIRSVSKVLNYFLLLCFCFKNLDLSDRQTTQLIKMDCLSKKIIFNGLQVLIKYVVEAVLLMNQIISWEMNFINRLLENSKREKFIHVLETIFGALI